MRLSIRGQWPGRLALVDLDRGGAPIPYPVVTNACAWDWWRIPSRFGLGGPPAWDYYGGDTRESREVWRGEQARLMRRAGISACAMYVDVSLWAAENSGLWGWPVLVPAAQHARDLTSWAQAGDVESAVRLLAAQKDALLEAIGRHGRTSSDVVAVCGWNELCWNLLLQDVIADVALDWSARVLARTAELLASWFPAAVRVLDRVAGSLRKDREESGWIGRRGWVGERWTERPADDPASHWWRYVRACGAGADAVALNYYSDEPTREDLALDAVCGALAGWGGSGAVVLSESHWALSRGWPHRLLWAQYAYPGAPRWTYPWGGTAEQSAALYGRAFLEDARHGGVIASSTYGWVAHAPSRREPLGGPWGPVIPAVPGVGGREFRDLAFIDTLAAQIAHARDERRRLIG